MIDTLCSHQFNMSPAFHQRAILQYQDTIRIDYARQAMGENKHRAIFHQAVQCLLYHRFILGINGRERFIQHQKGRIA